MIKEFFIDYLSLCKETVNFYIEHWFGIIVLGLVLFGIIFSGLNVHDKIEEKKLNKFHKEEKRRLNVDSE